MSNLQISIIIPTYNSSRFILETLNSVLNQTYNNWECIIVDDGSNDDTIGIVKEFVNIDKRFSFYKREFEPKGASHCRNIGALKKSKGEYIIFLDSDDLLLETALENRIRLAQKYIKNDFWVFNTGVFNSDNNNKQFNYNGNENDLHAFLKHYIPLPWTIMGVLWKKFTLVKLGGFDIEFKRLQDPEIHTRALLKGFKYKFFKEMPYDNLYRVFNEKKINNNILLQSVELYLKQTIEIIKDDEIKDDDIIKSLKYMFSHFYRIYLWNNDGVEQELKQLYLFASNENNLIFKDKIRSFKLLHLFGKYTISKFPIIRGIYWRLWDLL